MLILFTVLFLSLFSFFPATALVHLCKQRDSETRRLALQTLELLAIENSDIIVTHVEARSSVHLSLAS